MTENDKGLNFSFANHASDFEDHIHNSIRGYADLRSDCISFSQYFVEDNTTVLDLGCSTGKFLSEVRKQNQDRAPKAHYLGMDIEVAFEVHWERYRAPNLDLENRDLRAIGDWGRVSFATALFSLQFVPERDRLDVMQRVFSSMLDGAGLVLAEKTFADSGKIQDMLTFMYYDYKRRHFSEADIMSKERSLRDQMKLWNEADIVRLLKKVGFREENIQIFWRNHLFLGILAIKGVIL